LSRLTPLKQHRHDTRQSADRGYQICRDGWRYRHQSSIPVRDRLAGTLRLFAYSGKRIISRIIQWTGFVTVFLGCSCRAQQAGADGGDPPCVWACRNGLTIRTGCTSRPRGKVPYSPVRGATRKMEPQMNPGLDPGFIGRLPRPRCVASSRVTINPEPCKDTPREQRPSLLCSGAH
jgi:hypothetical protein